MKFREIISLYPSNAPVEVEHAAPHFELGHNLCVYILLTNLAQKVVLGYIHIQLRKGLHYFSTELLDILYNNSSCDCTFIFSTGAGNITSHGLREIG